MTTMKSTTTTARLGLFAAVLALPLGAQNEEDVLVLEEFILSESASAEDGNLLPTSRPVNSVFDDLTILETPRSVTVLTPELMARFDIQDFSDLSKIGAGTQQQNFYGVPGTPVLRGAKGGVFFSGMQRGYQRNEMPLSFGSIEAMDIVKGPAPAHFGASQAGGYTNLIPKSPYFDKKRGSVMLEVGSWDHYRIQADVGGPTLVGDTPVAYRFSLTAQQADSYYDRIGNDFVSLYGSMKARLSDSLSLFTGAEYFNFQSNENAGWNRITQDLVDNDQYIIGEPASIISGAWGGVAVRSIAEFPGQNQVNQLLQALAIPGDIARSRIPTAQLGLMVNLNTQAGLDRIYNVDNILGGFGTNQGLIDQIAIAAYDAYVYTPAYFAAGGEVLTDSIEGSTVLSDNSDYANSENFVWFADVVSTALDETTIKGQFLVDYIKTEKLSTYGYAIDTEQLVLEAKLSAVTEFGLGESMKLTYGASARYTEAYMLQDFFAEPFARRDITQTAITPNSVILTGPQRGPDGSNFWSPTAQGGANADSELWQLSLFAFAENKWTDRFSTYTSLLGAHAPYTTAYPSEVDQVPANSPIRNKVSNEKDYFSISFSPVLALTENANLYATAQQGTSIDALQGGAIVGEGNFAENQLIEGGLKFSVLEDSLFASLAVYQWEQSAFDERTNNSEPLEGQGVELEVTWAMAPNLTVIASANNQQVERKSPLGFRSFPLTAEQIALYSGSLNSQFGPAVFDPGNGAQPANNPDLRYPGTPETQGKIFLVYGGESGFGGSLGAVLSESYWHNFDRTIKLPSSTVFTGSLFYRQPGYEVGVMIDNLTDEDYYYGADPVFAANTLLTKAPERNYKFTFTYKF